MKKLLLIITLILPLLLSSESWAIEYDDLMKREGLYYEKFTDIPFTGKVDDQPKLSFKDGKISGEYVSYYENGQLSYKLNYVNGELHGEGVSYHENGRLFFIENYVNDKKHGEYVDYYEDVNGETFHRGNYVNGKRHGEWVTYYPPGQLNSIVNYVNGVPQ
jgi:antitoxin component YwqK of YwqJK toxin-antitoxin module